MSSDAETKQTGKSLKTSSKRTRYTEANRVEEEERRIYRALGYHLRNADREMATALQRRLAEHNITVGMSIFLRCLWEEDGVTQRELARKAKLVEGTTTDILQQMEMAGLIVRVRNIIDRRKMNIYLTQPAKNLFSKLKAIHEEIDAKATEGISSEEMELFLKVLEKITTNISHDNAETGKSGRRQA